MCQRASLFVDHARISGAAMAHGAYDIVQRIQIHPHHHNPQNLVGRIENRRRLVESRMARTAGLQERLSGDRCPRHYAMKVLPVVIVHRWLII